MHKLKKQTLGLFIIVFLSGCTGTIVKRKKVVIPKKQQAHTKTNLHTQPITIFVHGTRLYPRALVKSIFHCPSGFHRADEMQNVLIHGRIAYELNKATPKEYPLDTFYLYCWSGNLGFKAREDAARILLQHIQKLVVKHQKKYGTRPYVRIIGHSHGCNVALNLALIKTKNDHLVIDQLILLAGPMQQATEKLVLDPMFKSIYSVYSRADKIQILDPQGLYKCTRKNGIATPLFSHRRLAPNTNLRQVKIKLNRRAPGHLEFILPYFVRRLPSIINAMNQWPELVQEQDADTEFLLKIVKK